MIGWEEIGDDERQIGGGTSRTSRPGEKGADREAVPLAAPEPKTKPDRRPFHTLRLAQQAGIRAGDEQFWKFIVDTHPNAWMALDEDEPFDMRAAVAIRLLCNVDSRSELGKGNHEADNKWRRLETEYQQWLTDNRYADTIR
jgi:hypothetical protein